MLLDDKVTRLQTQNRYRAPLYSKKELRDCYKVVRHVTSHLRFCRAISCATKLQVWHRSNVFTTTAAATTSSPALPFPIARTSLQLSVLPVISNTSSPIRESWNHVRFPCLSAAQYHLRPHTHSTRGYKDNRSYIEISRQYKVKDDTLLLQRWLFISLWARFCL